MDVHLQKASPIQGAIHKHKKTLVGDVGPHLPGVPAAPQQQRLMLVAIEELERLPHLHCLQARPFQHH